MKKWYLYFIKICKDRSGDSKRYLTTGINEPAYSGEWKLVYPNNIKRMKNGGLEDAEIVERIQNHPMALWKCK